MTKSQNPSIIFYVVNYLNLIEGEKTMAKNDSGEKCVECGKPVTVEESYLYGGDVHCEKCFRKKVPS